MGKVLRVDLSEEKLKEETISKKLLRAYIGGRGLGVRILYNELPRDLANFDPLGEENIVVVMTGPYTGTPGPASARYEVTTLSPHTGFVGASNAGGFFGPALKRAGFDGIIITGRSEIPVYLACIEGKYELRDAQQLWGLDTFKAEDLIKEDLANKNVRTMLIGPAGERKITFSAVINDRGRAAARAGAGAVLGSKKLKGIAVYGRQRISIAYPNKFREQIRHYNKLFKKDTVAQLFQLHGTSMGLLMQMLIGDVPVKNFQRGTFDKIKNLSARNQWDRTVVAHHACQGCIISCKRRANIEQGKYKLEEPASGPEYETVAAFGTNLLIDNIYAVTKANDLCNRLGIDTISTGVVIAYVTECFEKGLISKEELGGIEPKWGDEDAMLALLKLIAERKQLGEILARGVRYASKEIEGSEKLAIHVKGLEMPMHDPRSSYLMALHYATTPFGAHHTSAGEAVVSGMLPREVEDWDFVAKPDKRALDRLSPIGKARAVITIQNRSIIIDAMGMCVFGFMGLSIPPRFASAMLTLTTGWSMKYREQFLKTGERLFNLMHAFNLRCGWKPSDNTLPYRILNEPHPDGGSKGVIIRINKLLREYYRLRGWDEETGKPSQEKLEELGLNDVAKDLYQ